MYVKLYIGSSEERTIWMVCSPIVKKAFIYSRSTYDGTQLGLNRHGYRVWWQGSGGMVWDKLVPRIKYLLSFEDSPSILVLHCGGNSIGKVPLLDLRNQIGSSLWEIQSLLPSTRLVWSQILPRSSWRYSSNNMALNFAARRLNNFAAWLCIQLGGAYVKYPELAWDEEGLFPGMVFFCQIWAMNCFCTGCRINCLS